MPERWRRAAGAALALACAFTTVPLANARDEALHPPDQPPRAQAAPSADSAEGSGGGDARTAAEAAKAPGPDDADGAADAEAGAKSDSKDDAKKPDAPKKPEKPKPPVNPFKPNLFQNDFSYLNDPKNTTYVPGQELKNIPLECLDGIPLLHKSKISFGGELRHRYMDEDNRLRPGGPGKSTYDLWRWRNYIDYDTEFARVYVEMLDAASFGEELPEQIIDVNRWDIQNAFVDLKLLERDGKPIVFRTGRMELLYGAQRLVSPLDWGNTRRNFEGFLVSSKGESWDIDAFVTRPVNSAALNHFHRESEDHPDYSRTFSGVYSTFHGIKNHTFDLYWLWLREQQPRNNLPDGSRQTVGLRWNGLAPVTIGKDEVVRQWDWDVEGGYQFGHDDDFTNVERRVEAGFVTAIVGHQWMKLPWQPKISGLYYWGSGDRNRLDVENNTFSIYFPLGHAYWGILDNLSGQNLIDYSIQGQVKPTKKLTANAHIHWFNLDTAEDRIYTVPGLSIGGPTPNTNLGQELDLFGTYNFCPNFDVQAGYSWFWYGDAVTRTPLRRDDASQFYVQTTLRY